MITSLRYPKGHQFFDANGAPLALGTLSYYVAGTTTLQDTYADSAGTVANTNPVVLDGSGRLDVDVYLGSTANYKEVLTSASVTVSPWPDDNIPPATQADWDATNGPNQILNKPVTFTGDGGSGGASGFVPAPAAGDAVANKFLSASGTWVAPPSASGSVATDLSITQTSTSVGIGSSSGTGITIPEASPAAAGVLDASRAAKIDGLAAVATSGSYTDLANKPSIPSIPSSLSGQDIDNVARLGINTTDTLNRLSVNAPGVLFSNAGDMRMSISKGASSNIATVNFQDNYSTRAQFGLIGNDDFTISTSPDGSTFSNAIVATTAGAVSFPNTGGFTGDSGSGGSVGLVPAPAAGDAAAGKYLKADGTWAAPSGGGSMVYPGAGLPVSTGSAWDTAITPGAGVSAALAANVTGSNGIVLATAPTLTGAVLAAGSTTVAPLNLTSGTNRTTPGAGALEYDGHAPYFSPVAGVRGVIPVKQYSLVTASGGVALNNDANAQSYLPSGARTFPVEANVHYRFRARIALNLGTNSLIKSVLFEAAGSAAFSWINYHSDTFEGASSLSPMSLRYSLMGTTESAVAVVSLTANAYSEIQLEGEFVMSSGGTIQPQVKFNTAPGGTNVAMRGTYFELTALGPNAASGGLS